MKFSDMIYTRPELDETKTALAGMIDAFEQAADAAAARVAYMAVDAFTSRLSTMAALAYVRHSLDTNDAFFDAEQEYFDQNMPLLRELDQRLELALLSSPHRPALEKEFGALMFTDIEMSLKTFKPEIVADLQAENKLCSDYDKLLASAQIEFDGKKLNLPQLAPYHQDKDRGVRKASTEARAAWFMSHSGTLDDMFDRLVKTRTQMARKLGYENFIELGYYRMQRNCYDRDMVARFRRAVIEHIVPVTDRLKKEQASRIGVPSITVYDDPFNFPDGNARPFGSPEQIFGHGRKMYRELSPKTGEFIDFMMGGELFDVLARAGKSGGGYCIDFSDYKAPFIFANFNGTSDDIDVLTHEAGHAYAAYCARDIIPAPLRQVTYETAEVHSMSMEFFTWPWMDGFFGEQTAKYKYSHLAGALIFLPYGCMVDEFQHRVYERPDMTPAQRNALWLELEGRYRPWLDLAGFPFYGGGRRWQAQSHIYERPFYYIDYCLAQSTALAFWAEDRQNHAAAWDKYQKFIDSAGKNTFAGLIDSAALPSPFEADTLKTVAAAAVKWLDENARF